MSDVLRPYRDLFPQIGQRVMIDDSSVVIGDVRLADDVGIWPLVVIRGDVHYVQIGARTNIQDGSMLHVTHKSSYNPDGNPLTIGEDVTVGHKVMLHGCTIGNRVLVGMASILLDGAIVEDDVMIGAGSLVPQNKRLESGYLYLGSPVKQIRPLSDEEKAGLRYSANNYVKWKDEYLEWICGYANAQGGKIYIGCDDEGNIVGLPNARKLLEDIPNKIRDAMGIIVGVNLLDKDGKEYIEIDVPPYPIGISCKGVYYYRSGSTRQILTGPALEAFLMRKRGVTWDNLPLPAFSLDDVDDETVAHFKQWAARKGRIDKSVLDEPKDVLMEKLHLMNGPYLTNAAMLLFSKDPEKWQLGAYVKIGYFETDADLLYQDEIHGSILEQIDKIVELVYLKYMKAKITYEGMQRIERYFVPEEALREALLNALCHKQYQSGVPIQISVYEDKLYIANCGCLPENWTLENLMSKHASSPYNPNIAHVFYLAGFIESWGRGIEKICSACEKDGVPQPEYTINPGDIMIKFTAPEDRLIRSVTSRVTEKVTDKVTDTLDETSLKILNLLAVDPAYTTTFLAENLSLSRKTVSLRLKMLKENGLIERIGSDRKGYWKLLK